MGKYSTASPGWYSPLRSTGDFKAISKANKPQLEEVGRNPIDFKTHIHNLQQ